MCCQQTPSRPQESAVPPVQTFTGMVRYDNGFCSFKNCADGALYLIADSTLSMFRFHKKACEPAVCPDETAFAIVQGRLMKGADPRTDPGTLAIIRIDSMAGKNRENACFPVDYWCSGTEPFWSLQISKQEKALFFKEMSSETGRTFDWAPPVEKNGILTYTVKNRQQPEQTIVVTITPERCSDGMSDEVYPNTVTIRDGKTTWSGCAR